GAADPRSFPTRRSADLQIGDQPSSCIHAFLIIADARAYGDTIEHLQAIGEEYGDTLFFRDGDNRRQRVPHRRVCRNEEGVNTLRSEEHTSELQSRESLV